MSDLEHARDLLAMARSDLNALRGMLQVDDRDAKEFFSDEIFGFHAQQSVEKILKARVASLGGSYPKTHDLMLLLSTLSGLGQDVTDLMELVDLNSYAVQFRYEAFDLEDDELDRDALLKTVSGLFETMSGRIG